MNKSHRNMIDRFLDSNMSAQDFLSALSDEEKVQLQEELHLYVDSITELAQTFATVLTRSAELFVEVFREAGLIR